MKPGEVKGPSLLENRGAKGALPPFIRVGYEQLGTMLMHAVEAWETAQERGARPPDHGPAFAIGLLVGAAVPDPEEARRLMVRFGVPIPPGAMPGTDSPSGK